MIDCIGGTRVHVDTAQDSVPTQFGRKYKAFVEYGSGNVQEAATSSADGVVATK